MVFADLIFLYIFLPLNLILYYATGHKAVRNGILILFSLFFYAWGEPVWILLLIFSATIDYIHGLIIHYSPPKSSRAKLAVASSLILNLGLLSVFKYGAFFTEGINTILGTNFPLPEFSLPIGISFYTFQTISYVVDVYRGEVKAQQSYFKFLMFVSLYHQLVAGPIVRYSHIANEIDSRKTDIRDISTGVNRFVFGLAKKVLIANTAGALAVPYLEGDISSLTVMGAWYGILLFALQIYFDFSGYSDMAIGLGRMFGFHYGENFNYPYIANSATEFWRRWHISLGSFFRDYLYIPLGGNKRHQMLNLLIVWFATGLWHGANMNFVLWGLFWGVLVVMEKKFLNALLLKLPKIIGHIYLITAVLIGLVIFYFTDLSRVGAYLASMFGVGGIQLYNINLQLDITSNIYWLILSLLLCTPIMRLLKDSIANYAPISGQKLLLTLNPIFLAALLMLSTALLVGESYNPFLYFRF